MRSLHVRAHVNEQGAITLQMPPELADRDVDLVVVYTQPERGGATEPQTAAKGWPPGFFEVTAGGWQGTPLTREPEGDYEQRDEL